MAASNGQLSVVIEKGMLVIRIPVNEKPTEADKSGSGKTLLVASSHGPFRSDVMISGKPVTVSVNAYVKP